jgi:hypothetical protein
VVVVSAAAAAVVIIERAAFSGNLILKVLINICIQSVPIFAEPCFSQTRMLHT